MLDRQHNFTKPILVLGSPRSGTSLTAGCLAFSGVWSGVCRPADHLNPKGYFENVRLKDMRKRGVLQPNKVHAVLESEGWQGEPWLHKHTPYRISVWERFDPTIVLVWRDQHDIAVSRERFGCYKETPEEAWQTIIQHHEIMKRCYDRFDRVIDVFPGKVVEGDYSDLDKVLSIYGLTLNTVAAGEFLERDLWHQNHD